MGQMQQERMLRDSGEMRGNSNFGAGQIVAADYGMTPSISFSQKDAGGMGAALGGVSRGLGVLGAIAGSMRFSEASTMLMLTDNRSGVQLAAAEGSSKNTDFGMWGGCSRQRRRRQVATPIRRAKVAAAADLQPVSGALKRRLQGVGTRGNWAWAARRRRRSCPQLPCASGSGHEAPARHPAPRTIDDPATK
jgi:hypothetical protein